MCGFHCLFQDWFQHDGLWRDFGRIGRAGKVSDHHLHSHLYSSAILWSQQLKLCVYSRYSRLSVILLLFHQIDRQINDFLPRCLIPECEIAGDTHYNVPWRDWAIPGGSKTQILDSKSHFCDRYAINQTLINSANQTCTKDLFANTIETCSEWVFDYTERTIVNDVRYFF